MLSKYKKERSKFVSMEEFIPQEHLLRKIYSSVDFTHIYDIIINKLRMNSQRNGSFA